MARRLYCDRCKQLIGELPDANKIAFQIWFSPLLASTVQEAATLVRDGKGTVSDVCSGCYQAVQEEVSNG
jgi:hypothetical protein